MKKTILIAALAPAVLPTALQAKECYAPDARAQERAFSRAVITEGGKTVWLAGQTASNAKADFEAQAREVFASLDKTIKAVGGRGLADMVTMTVFISDHHNGDRFTQIRKEIFKECFPASALITVTGFARPGLLLEIQGVAVIGGKCRTTKRSQEHLEHMSHTAMEAFTGHRIVKAFGAEAQEARRFAAASHRVYRTNMKVTSALSVLPPLMELLGGLGMAAALWYGARQIAAERLTTGEFTSFIAAMFLMYEPIKKLSRVNANLQQAIAAGQRIFEMLDTHTEVQDRPGAAPLAPLGDRIEFREVSFAYEDGDRRRILDGVSFAVRAGQVVAIVGRHPGAFREVYPARRVNNLYLDSHDLPDFYDHINGVSHRKKTRIRWYGTPVGRISAPALELKLKRGLVNRKVSHRLPAIPVNGHVSRTDLEDGA